jgi:hypothetical protein
MARPRPDAVGLGITLLIVAALTSLPGAVRDVARIEFCLVCGTNGGATALLNVALFMPVGFFMRRLSSPRHAVIVGALLSLFIEGAQLFIPGRETALSDLVANTLGAALGAAIAPYGAAWLRPRALPSRLVAGALATLFSAFILASGPLLDPSTPDGDYYGQWTPKGRHHPQYQGEVIGATLGGVPVPSRLLDDPLAVRTRLVDGSMVDLRFRASAPTALLEPVLRIVAGSFGNADDALVIGADGEDLVLWLRTRAEEYRLSRPTHVLHAALRGVGAGDTVRLLLRRAPGRGIRVGVHPRRPIVLSFHPGRSWSLIYAPPVRAPEALLALDHLWYLGVAVVIGWYALGWPVALLATAMVTGATIAAPLGSDLVAAPYSLLLIFAAGTALGAWVRRRAGERTLHPLPAPPVVA